MLACETPPARLRPLQDRWRPTEPERSNQPIFSQSVRLCLFAAAAYSVVQGYLPSSRRRTHYGDARQLQSVRELREPAST